MGEPMPCAIPLDEVADPFPFPAMFLGERVVALSMSDGWVTLFSPDDGMSAHPARVVPVDVSRPGGQQLVGRWLESREDGSGASDIVMAIEALLWTVCRAENLMEVALVGDLDTEGQCDLCALVARVLEAQHA